MSTLPDNPYIADETRRKAYVHLVLQLIKLYSMTVRADEDLTDRYILLALQHGAVITGDRLTGFYAAVWECAHFINAAVGPDVAEVTYETGEPACAHETCKVDNEAQAALIEAAVRGDGDAIKGVCKAVVAESRRRNQESDDGDPEPPEVALYMLWTGALRRFLNVMAEPEG